MKQVHEDGHDLGNKSLHVVVEACVTSEVKPKACVCCWVVLLSL